MMKANVVDLITVSPEAGGVGQLFDYDPELEPSQYFLDLIKNAIENSN